MRSVFESNILQMIAVTKFAASYMVRGAAIINTTSVVAYSGNPRLGQFILTFLDLTDIRIAQSTTLPQRARLFLSRAHLLDSLLREASASTWWLLGQSSLHYRQGQGPRRRWRASALVHPCTGERRSPLKLLLHSCSWRVWIRTV